MPPPPPNLVQLGFFVVMPIMIGQIHLVAKLARNKQDITCYKMEEQHKRQLEEQLLKLLEADRLVCRDKNSDPIPHKKQCGSCFCWELAHLTIEHNFCSPNPVFDNRKFAHFFCIMKAMADELLAYVASQDPKPCS
jgi:hypothetical protein